MNNIKLLIFDFDGTIANTIPHIANCLAEAADKFGLIRIPDDEVNKLNGYTLIDILNILGAKPEQISEIIKYYFDNSMNDISDIELFNDVKESLIMFKKEGYILTIATNREKKTLDKLLKYLDIDYLFDIVITEDDVVNKKPHPDMANIILNKTKINNDEALVIGDTSFDILMGKNSNCKTCLISRDQKIDDELLLLKPDIIINNFSELSARIKSSNH